jgi:hypothetical protein
MRVATMSTVTSVPNTDPHALLRLEAAARIAFPDGSVKASALRREALAGRLVIYRIANKDFTTITDIKEMTKRCRVQAKGRMSTTTSSADCSISETANSNEALASMKLTARALKEHLQSTSSKSTTRKKPSTKIIPIKPK